jgi:hypothetical protein
MFTTIKHLMREHVFSRLPTSGDSFIYGLLGILVILGPLFFIPTRGFSVISSKGFFIFFIGIFCLLAYGIHALRKGVLIFPRQKIFGVVLLIVLTGLLGSFLSGGFGYAFLGYGFETTSWLFLALFGLILFFSYLVVNSFERIRDALRGNVSHVCYFCINSPDSLYCWTCFCKSWSTWR